MANPSPRYKFKPADIGEVASKPVSVKLPPDLDMYVRSLPNRAEWLRQAIAAQVERDREYKVFKVNAADSQVESMKIREV